MFSETATETTSIPGRTFDEIIGCLNLDLFTTIIPTLLVLVITAVIILLAMRSQHRYKAKIDEQNRLLTDWEKYGEELERKNASLQYELDSHKPIHGQLGEIRYQVEEVKHLVADVASRVKPSEKKTVPKEISPKETIKGQQYEPIGAVEQDGKSSGETPVFIDNNKPHTPLVSDDRNTVLADYNKVLTGDTKYSSFKKTYQGRVYDLGPTGERKDCVNLSVQGFGVGLPDAKMILIALKNGEYLVFPKHQAVCAKFKERSEKDGFHLFYKIKWADAYPIVSTSALIRVPDVINEPSIIELISDGQMS